MAQDVANGEARPDAHAIEPASPPSREPDVKRQHAGGYQYLSREGE
jgi:hypothetical protein